MGRDDMSVDWLRFPACLVLLAALATPIRADDAHNVVAARGVVVSVSPLASDVGLDVLRRGGNGVDAAVATALALAVTWPEAGNIGGGGFMMVLPGPGKPPVCVEYRETAPAAAAVDMFGPQETILTHKAVGVPGTVRGLWLAHQKYGKQPWKELALPAVRLAEDGVTLDAPLAKSLNATLEKSAALAEFRRVYGKNGGREKWQAGDRLVQKELATTLRRIAEHGADGFYRGPVADLIVAEMKRGGGLITLADLAQYEAKLREPIHGTYRGYDVYAPPSPSSGGICLVEMLNILENFDLKKLGRDSPQATHLTIEAMRRAYCDRARHLGDADFVKVPAHLTTKEYAKKLAAGIDPRRAAKSEDLAADIPLAGESGETTHFSIIDAAGMAVANTYTLEESFGSRIVVRGGGFLLNNEMGDFNWRPGVTDRKGTIGTKPNQIAPGKRMLSSQTPTIVCRGGKPVLVTGSPGGRTIINTVLQVVLGVVEYDLDARAAVDAPRLHHQWFPDVVRLEGVKDSRHAGLRTALTALGHRIDSAGARQGDAHTILIKAGQYHAAADRRRNGKASGY